MPRRASIDPPVPFHVQIPASLKGWIDTHLWSEVDGRVPHGGHRGFFIELIVEYRASQAFDLSPYGAPPGYSVRGRPEVLEKLKELLEKVK